MHFVSISTDLTVTQCLVPQSTSPTMIMYSSPEDAVALQKSLCSTPRRSSSPRTGAPTPNMSALMIISNESGWQVTLTVFTRSPPSAGAFSSSCTVALSWGPWSKACCVWCLGGKAKDGLTDKVKSPTRRLIQKYEASINVTQSSNFAQNAKAPV